MINLDQVKKYCCEDFYLIEGFEKCLNSPERCCIHHREEIQEDGTIVSKKRLIDEGRYYNIEAKYLIAMTLEEHITLHNKNRTTETRDKQRYALKGKSLSDEHKNKIRQAHFNIKATNESKIKNRNSHLGKRRVYREDGTYYYVTPKQINSVELFQK